MARAVVVSLVVAVMFVVVFASLGGVREVSAKHIEGTVALTSGKVVPLGKFSFRPEGIATISGEVTYRGEDRGSLYVFMDTEWNEYHSNHDDCSRMQKATTHIPIGRSGRNQGSGKGTAMGHLTETNGLKKWTFDWTIEHRMRTYGYFLVIGDCAAHQGGKRYKSLTYSIDFFNPHNDHFPSDEHGLFTTYILVFLVLLGYLASVYTASLRQKGGRTVSVFNEGPPTVAVALLMTGYICELLSIFCEVIHLYWYGSNGYGIFAFDFFSEILEGFSQTVIGYLLLSLACGWTLVEGAVTSKSSSPINPEALGEDHPATMFIFALVILTIILQLLNKLILFDDFTKFHDYESWPGFLLVFVRAVLSAVFSYQIRQTIKYQVRSRGGGGRVGAFMSKLEILGGLWFWSFPLLVTISSAFVAHYVRHRVVTGGVLFFQTGSLIALSRQIYAESSAYNKASVYGGVLPTVTSPAKGV